MMMLNRFVRNREVGLTLLPTAEGIAFLVRKTVNWSFSPGLRIGVMLRNLRMNITIVMDISSFGTIGSSSWYPQRTGRTYTRRFAVGG